MSENNLNFNLDFTPKFDNDKLKSEIKNFESELKKIRKVSNIINTEDTKNALKQIESQFGNIKKQARFNVKGDVSEALKKLKILNEKAKEVSKGASFTEKINFDTSKFTVGLSKSAKNFELIRKNAEVSFKSQLRYAEKLLSQGKENTNEYKKAVGILKELKGVIKAASDSQKMLNSSSKGFGNSLKGSFVEMQAGLQLIQQISGTVQQYTEPFIALDKNIRNIGTLGVKNFKEFEQAAIQTSKSFPDSADKIAGAIYNAISGGSINVKDGFADVSQGIEFIEASSKLAVAGLTDIDSAVVGLGANLNAYGEGVQQAGEYSDFMFNTVNAGVTSIPQLNASLSNVIPTAAAFGVSFDQIGGAISTMTKQGVKTAQSTTQLRAVLVELAKPGAALKPIMEAAGVSLESLKKEGLQVSLSKIGDEMGNMGLAATQVFSSVEAAGAVMALTGKNAIGAAKDWKFVRDTVGTTDKAFDIASQGIEVKNKILLNQIQSAFNSAFSTLGDSFTGALNISSQIFPLISTLSLIPQLLKTSSLAAGLFSKAMLFTKTSILGMIPSLGLVGASGTISFGSMTVSATAFWAAATLGVAAAIGALIWFFTQMESGKSVIDTITEYIVSFGSRAVSIFKNIGKLIISFYTFDFNGIAESMNEMNNIFEEGVTEAEGKLAGERLNKLFNEQIQINEDLDKANKIGDLVTKFENATSEIEKQRIAKKIASQVPEALNSVETVIDKSTGEISTVYDISLSKAKNYVDKQVELSNTQLGTGQKEYMKLLKDQAGLFELNQKELVRLEDAMKQQQKSGGDIRPLLDEYNELKNELKGTRDAISETVQKGQKLGLLTDQVDNLGSSFGFTKQQIALVSKAAAEMKLNEAQKNVFEDSFKIKSNLDENNKIGELVNKYKNASTEIEKEQLAEKIASQVPESLTDMTTVIDETTGKIKTVYKINSDEISSFVEKQNNVFSSELLSKQKAYQSGLKNQIESYRESKESLIEMSAEIKKQKKAGNDIEPLVNKYNELKDKVNEAQVQMGETVIKGQEIGIVSENVDEMAQSWGYSTEEVKELKQMIDSAKKSTILAGNEVVDYSQQWKDAKKSTSEALTKGKEILAQMRAEGKSGTKEYRSQLKLIKSIAKDSKVQADIERQIAKELGLSASKTSQSGKKRIDILKNIFDKEKNVLDINLQRFEIEQESKIISEKRKKNSADDIILENQKLENLEKQQKLLLNTFKITQNKKGEVQFGVRLKETEKEDVRNMIDDLNLELSKQKNSVDNLKTEVNFDVGKLDDIKLKQSRIKIKAEIDTANIKELPNLYSQLTVTYEEELNKIESNALTVERTINNTIKNISEQKKLLSETNIKEEQNLIQNTISQLNITLSELTSKQTDLFNSNKKISEKIVKINTELIDKQIEEENRKFNEIEYLNTERLNKEYDFSINISRLRNDSLAIQESRELKLLDDKLSEQFNKKKSALELQKEYELISEEEFNSKLKDLEISANEEKEKRAEAHKQKLIEISQRAEGEELLIQMEKDNQILSLQKEGLLKSIALQEEQYKLTGSAEDKFKLDKLKKNLDDTQKLLEEKGTLLGVSSKQVQSTVTESLSNLFAGNPEDAKKSFKKLFQVTAGALERMASAWVTQLVLGPGVMSYINAIPFPGNVVALTAIKVTLDSLVKKIMGNTVSKLLSFSSGGEVPSPTVFIAGDAAKTADTNREWVFNNENLKDVVNMAIKSNTIEIIRAMKDIQPLNQQVVFIISGENLVGVLNQYNSGVTSRLF